MTREQILDQAVRDLDAYKPDDGFLRDFLNWARAVENNGYLEVWAKRPSPEMFWIKTRFNILAAQEAMQ